MTRSSYILCNITMFKIHTDTSILSIEKTTIIELQIEVKYDGFSPIQSNT